MLSSSSCVFFNEKLPVLLKSSLLFSSFMNHNFAAESGNISHSVCTAVIHAFGGRFEVSHFTCKSMLCGLVAAYGAR